MNKKIAVIFALTASAACAADPPADSFSRIYANTCLRHLHNLDELRSKLKKLPTLPADKAEFFLQNKPGNAWPVPDKNGTFVLAIPDNQNFCAVFARRVNAAAAEQQFRQIAEAAPAPLVSRNSQDERKQTPKNGPTHTISYAWSAPKTATQILLTLTTATGENADIQGLASAALVK